MVDSIYQLREKDKKGMPRSNIGGWHSNDEIHNIKKFTPLVKDILKNAKDCFNHMDVKDNYNPEISLPKPYDPENFDSKQLEITNNNGIIEVEDTLKKNNLMKSNIKKKSVSE